MFAGTILERTVCALGFAGLLISSLKAEEIPFESSLKEANIALQSLQDGQGEGLMLGNGDLYGLVWERSGVLTMRVTKNDIWDARVDTSEDGELPKVDIAGGKVAGLLRLRPATGCPILTQSVPLRCAWMGPMVARVSGGGVFARPQNTGLRLSKMRPTLSCTSAAGKEFRRGIAPHWPNQWTPRLCACG